MMLRCGKSLLLSGACTRLPLSDTHTRTHEHTHTHTYKHTHLYNHTRTLPYRDVHSPAATLSLPWLSELPVTCHRRAACYEVGYAKEVLVFMIIPSLVSDCCNECRLPGQSAPGKFLSKCAAAGGAAATACGGRAAPARPCTTVERTVRVHTKRLMFPTAPGTTSSHESEGKLLSETAVKHFMTYRLV